MEMRHGSICVDVEPPWNSIMLERELVDRIELLGLGKFLAVLLGVRVVCDEAINVITPTPGGSTNGFEKEAGMCKK